VAADQRRLKGLTQSIPLESEKVGEIRGILNAQQNMMMRLAEGLNKYKEDTRANELNNMIMKLNVMPYFNLGTNNDNLGYPLQSQSKRYSHKKESQLQIISNERLDQLKVSYLRSEKNKDSLLRSLKMDPTKKDDFRIIPNPNLKNTNLKQKFLIENELNVIKNTQITPYGRFRAIAKSIARMLTLRRNIGKYIEVMKKEQQLYMRHDIDLHFDVARAWLLKVMKLFITSVHLIWTCR